MDENPHKKSISYALYELKNQDPQAYAGVQKFIQTIAPKLEPSEDNPHFASKQALASLLILQKSVASVDSGVIELIDRIRGGEKDLTQQLHEASARSLELMGGEDRYVAYELFLSNHHNKTRSEPHEASTSETIAQTASTKWQDYLKSHAAQTAISVAPSI
ncbi:MAG: hypothetical protein EAZ74_01815 [Alphaproteobacteria bacterium]|nr:MAG: hypothetical protein EAZ74_01815 [Alphaproteobacteria bacterium]